MRRALSALGLNYGDVFSLRSGREQERGLLLLQPGQEREEVVPVNVH